MRISFIGTLILVCTSTVLGAIQTKIIEYKAGDTTLKGLLAWDDSIKGKRPGVIVVHEWWGNKEYAQQRARQLAEMGYVGFAADMYGAGKTTDHAKEAGEWAGKIMNNRALGMVRAKAAYDTLKAQDMVDPERIAAIGYCFGGAIVLEMAREGIDLDGVASFHGGLATSAPATGPITARIRVCDGSYDRFVSAEEMTNFKEEMDKAGAKYEIIIYPGAQHSFTVPSADSRKIDNIKYDAAADRKSWDDLKRFLENVLK